MRIVKLTAENVKRIKCVEITPEGNLVVVGGQNGAGKSSLLDSIMYALAGKKGLPSQPVRDGEDKATIVVELDDFIVRRTMTHEGGGTLTVTTADGKAKFATPQGLLDGLTGRLAFNPLAFHNQGALQQRATLMDLAGLNFGVLDGQRTMRYDDRRDTNRQLNEARGALANQEHYVGLELPAEEVTLKDLTAELERRREHNRANALERVKLAKDENDLALASKRVQRLEEELEVARRTLAKREATVAATRQRVAELEDQDDAGVLQAINESEGTNMRIRANRDWNVLDAKVKGLEVARHSLDGEIKNIDQKKAEALAAATFPIDGLSFSEDGVTYNGHPLDQCGQAEQLRISVAIGLALNPKLKILLIRNGSLLDAEGLKLVAEMAAAADAQVWIERVGDGAECQVILEDGMVRDG